MAETDNGVWIPGTTEPYPEEDWWLQNTESIEDYIAARIADHERIGDNSNTGNVALDGTESIILRVEVTIPAEWATWTATWGYTWTLLRGTPSSDRFVDWRLRRNSNLMQANEDDVLFEDGLNRGPLKSLTGGSSGETATGLQQFDLSGQLGSNDDYSVTQRYGWVRAVRTA